MVTRAAILPSIPAITGVDAALKSILAPIKTILDAREGRSSNYLEQVVTYRDLENAGINLGVYGGGIISSSRPTSGTSGDTIAPGAPSGITVAAIGLNSHRITWTNPGDSDLYYVEIWRKEWGPSDDHPTFSEAELVAIVTVSEAEIGQTVYRELSGIEPDLNYDYWLVAVDWSGNRSDVAFAGSALYTDNKSITEILNTLQGDIDYDHISDQLQTACDVSETVAEGVVFSTNVNGHLNGIVHANDGTTASMYFVTDEFHIINPGGTAYQVPFSVGTVAGVSTVGIKGQLVIDGTIKASAIDGGAFGTLTITAGTINITSAGVLNINSGGQLNVSSGTISIGSTGTFTISSGGTFNINSTNGILFSSVSKISYTGTYMGLSPTANKTYNLSIGESGNYWSNLWLYGDYIYLTGSTSVGVVSPQFNITAGSAYRFNSTGLYPTSGSPYLGTSSYPWSRVYASAYYVGSTAGVSGSFTAGTNTVTVTNGIITSIA